MVFTAPWVRNVYQRIFDCINEHDGLRRVSFNYTFVDVDECEESAISMIHNVYVRLTLSAHLLYIACRTNILVPRY